MDATTTAELTIRMIVGLAVVLGLLALGTRLARRQVSQTKAIDIDVRGRQVLTKASSIAVVKVGERHLLLGVNDNGVSLLAEGDDLATPVEPAPTRARTKLGGRPTRRSRSAKKSGAPTTRSGDRTTAPTPSPALGSGPATDATSADVADAGPADASAPGVVDLRSTMLESLRQKTVRRS